MKRQYYVIDAFTSERYAGNPAAVVLDTDGLDDSEMQQIAAEFNLSETTFVLPPQTTEASVRFRWLTPTTEVSMCGHGTIAGVHALIDSGRFGADESGATTIGIDTLSGTLKAYVETIPEEATGRMIWLDLPKPRFKAHPLAAEELGSVLNLPTDAFEPDLPIVETQEHDLLVFVRSFMAVNKAKPDWEKVKALQIREGLRGLCLATTNTLTPSVHVQSRFFASAAGIDEDPVTGSVHGPLTAYVVAHGRAPTDNGLAGLQCVQSKAGGRAGVVFALVQQQEDKSFDVRIGGQAVTTMKGTLVQ